MWKIGFNRCSKFMARRIKECWTLVEIEQKTKETTIHLNKKSANKETQSVVATRALRIWCQSGDESTVNQQSSWRRIFPVPSNVLSGITQLTPLENQSQPVFPLFHIRLLLCGWFTCGSKQIISYLSILN